MKILKCFKRRKTVKKVNKALNIKLHKWQIDFIFDGKPYSEEVKKERCNGKTLAHVLRICLKSTNADIKNLLREGSGASSCLYILRTASRKWAHLAGEDQITIVRRLNFYFELRSTYERLASEKKMKNELRDIRFYMIQEEKRLI